MMGMKGLKVEQKAFSGQFWCLWLNSVPSDYCSVKFFMQHRSGLCVCLLVCLSSCSCLQSIHVTILARVL